MVELDGGQHNGSYHDERRDAWLQAQGYTVPRFWNDDVLIRADAVLSTIWPALETPLDMRTN